MTAQEKAVLEAMSQGALDLNAPFLTHGELLDAVRRVSGMLGGDPKRLSRHTVQAWVRGGVFGASKNRRKTRNRLYSGVDLLRLATIFHATHVGISVRAALRFADIVREQMAVHLERWGEPLEKTASFDPRDYLLAFTSGGRFRVHRPDPQHTEEQLSQIFALEMKGSGLGVILNSRMLVTLSIAILREEWNGKAARLAGKLQRYLDKRRHKRR